MAAPAPKRRFVSVTNEVLNTRTPKSTRVTTKVWIRMLECFIDENGLECNLKTCTKEELAEVLCRCYLGMRKADKTTYQKPSYLGFRCAVNRHMSDRGFDLF